MVGSSCRGAFRTSAGASLLRKSGNRASCCGFEGELLAAPTRDEPKNSSNGEARRTFILSRASTKHFASDVSRTRRVLKVSRAEFRRRR